jgi:hypothetical protein
MNWKDMEGGGSGLIFRYYPGIRLEGLRKSAKILSGEPVRGPRFEPMTYRIRSRCDDQSITTKGKKAKNSW